MSMWSNLPSPGDARRVRRRPLRGFTLIELMTALVLVTTLAGIVLMLARTGGEAAAKAAEVHAARDLVVMYRAGAESSSGRFLPGYDRTVNEVEFPDGTVVGGPTANRYPFRLALATDTPVENIVLRGRNEDQIPLNNRYVLSLHPTFGINHNFVGGNIQQDGSVSFREDCILLASHAGSATIVFASAGMRASDGSVTEGFNLLTPPNLTGGMWRSEKWTPDSDPGDYGNLHARHGGKAVTGLLDGSVRLLGIGELRDMRLWSRRAAAENDPDYTIPRSTGGRF